MKHQTKIIDSFCFVTDYVANGSFASLKQGVTYRNKPDYAILVRVTDFTKKWNGNYVWVDKKSYDFLNKSSLIEGDLIIANVGETGKCFIVPNLGQPMTLGPNSILVRPQPETCNTKYLYYYFSSEVGRAEIEKISSATTQSKFNKTSFRKLEIPLPPLHKQEQIADTLDKADALHRKDQELLQKYDELAQAVFYDMFGDPVRNERGWDITRGKDTFIFSSGKFNPTKNLHNSFPYPTYGGNGITGFSKEKLIEYSTIVIGRVGAYCGSVHLTEKESWITDNAIYLKSGFQDFDITFLLFLFKKLNLNQFADYSGQPKITQKPLEELGYIKPPQVLQKKFGQLVQNINSTKNMLSKAYSEDLNQNLLYRYLS
jgi:type I restriction enzyme S subunit